MDISNSEKGRKLRMLSWRQYNQAIQNVLQETNAGRLPMEILLIFCLLFNQYEIFQCDHHAAYAHIKSGQKLLLEWSQTLEQSRTSPGATQTSTVVDMINEHIAPMVTRLDVQASMLMHSQAPSERYTQPAMTIDPIIPPIFDSFARARQIFDHCASWMFHNLAQRPEICDEAVKAGMRDVFERWWLAFSALLSQNPITFSSEEDKIARLLRVYYNFARIVLDTYQDLDEMGFDEQTERFRTMISYCQDAVRPHRPGDHLRQSFSFDISSASPLFFIASRCRVPQLRRQAISILQAAEQCSWNCEHSAMIAQHLADTEESGLETITTCQDIPVANRVRRVHTKVSFEEAHIELQHISWPYSDKSSVNIAILPLRTNTEDSGETSGELLPQLPSNDPSSSTLDSDVVGET